MVGGAKRVEKERCAAFGGPSPDPLEDHLRGNQHGSPHLVVDSLGAVSGDLGTKNVCNRAAQAHISVGKSWAAKSANPLTQWVIGV